MGFIKVKKKKVFQRAPSRREKETHRMGENTFRLYTDKDIYLNNIF